MGIDTEEGPAADALEQRERQKDLQSGRRVETEAGFMHSYVVGHIGLDPSQPSILRNGDRGRRESSRQVLWSGQVARGDLAVSRGSQTF